jgi:molybdate transport system substrate-binding protein
MGHATIANQCGLLSCSLIMSFRFYYITVGLVLIGCNSVAAQSVEVRIAAASDLKFAMDSIISVFEKSHKINVAATYGSSGKLYEQIVSKAPFDLFFSADEAYPNRLSELGLTRGNVVMYAIGRLAIWSTVVDPSSEKTASLTNPRISHIAIANPQHAPYGKRAVEALKHYKIYEKVKSKLVLGENISQASQFVYSGAAQVGILALSLVLSPPMQKQKGKYYVLPESSHEPLRQGYVKLAAAGDEKATDEFYQFLAGQQATGILKYYGFSVPETVKK